MKDSKVVSSGTRIMEYEKPMLIDFKSEVVFGDCNHGPSGSATLCDVGNLPTQTRCYCGTVAEYFDSYDCGNGTTNP